MTLDEAGRLQKAWKSRNGHKICHHTRMVDYVVSKTGRRKETLVCRECGAVLPDAEQAILNGRRKLKEKP